MSSCRFGEICEADSADLCTGKFLLTSMGGRAEGSRVQTWERGPPSAWAEISPTQTLIMTPDILHWKSWSQNVGPKFHKMLAQAIYTFHNFQNCFKIKNATIFTHKSCIPKNETLLRINCSDCPFFYFRSFHSVNCLEADPLQLIVGHDYWNFDKNLNSFKLTKVIVHLFVATEFFSKKNILHKTFEPLLHF